MTIKAPPHKQRFVLVGERHFVNAPVAFHTPDAFVYMNAMVEISKFGQVVNPLPCDRRACPVAGPHEFEGGCTDPNLLVAVHADLRRGHTSKGGRFDRCVTIATVDAKLADMM